jgi:hypothetical protein
MNMYYGLSVMSLRRDVSAADYSEDAIADPEILAFMPRIKIVVITEQDAHASIRVWTLRRVPGSDASPTDQLGVRRN